MDKEILESFDIPPSTNIIKVLAHSGYSIESAIADIVDNSFSSGAKRISITFARKGKESYVEISDDGSGMNDLALQSAMSFANKDMLDVRSSEDLGRYGVGMKTASASFCKELYVISKGSEGKINSYFFPFQEEKWKIFKIKSIDNSIETPTGTKVIWKDLVFSSNAEENKRILSSDSESFSRIVEKVMVHLEAVFGLLIKNGLEIQVNENVLSPWIPFEIPGKDVETVFNDNSFEISGCPVHVMAYLLPVAEHMGEHGLEYATCHANGKLADYEGFYIYRNNRLIVKGGWLGIPGLGISEKFNYARICVYLDSSSEMDQYVRLNFSKNTVTLPEEFSNYLSKVAKIARSKSSTNYDYRKNPRPYQRHNSDVAVPVWDITRKMTSSAFTINKEHPLIKKYTQGMDPKKIDALFSLLEKEFPFKELENRPPEDVAYSNEELQALFLEEMNSLVDSGLTPKDSFAKLLLETPFSEKKNRNRCITFFANMEIEEKTKENTKCPTK
jgi:predicted secreted protein